METKIGQQKKRYCICCGIDYYKMGASKYCISCGLYIQELLKKISVLKRQLDIVKMEKYGTTDRRYKQL